jgi:WD40 repeat protein
VKYWDIRQRKCVDTLRGHKSTVFAVAAAAAKDGGPPCMYFTGSRDHTIKVRTACGLRA